MGKSKPIKAAEVVTASTALPEKGKVWITLFSDGKDHEVSTTLAKTLINKNAAKMKKLIVILFAFLAFGMAQAQNGQRLTFTPATNDSIVGAATKYCTLASPISGRWNGVIEVYITPSISSSDSTHVWVEGSQNGSTWYTLTGLGTPMLNTGTYYITGTYIYKGRMGTTASSWMWSPTWYINSPYLRVAVQHFKAATSVKITRAAIYLKR